MGVTSADHRDDPVHLRQPWKDRGNRVHLVDEGTQSDGDTRFIRLVSIVRLAGQGSLVGHHGCLWLGGPCGNAHRRQNGDKGLAQSEFGFVLARRLT